MKKFLSVCIVLVLLFSCAFGTLSFAADVPPENTAKHEYNSPDGTTLITYDIPETPGNASEIYAIKTTVKDKSTLPLAKYDAIRITANGQFIDAYATGYVYYGNCFPSCRGCKSRCTGQKSILHINKARGLHRSFGQ